MLLIKVANDIKWFWSAHKHNSLQRIWEFYQKFTGEKKKIIPHSKTENVAAISCQSLKRCGRVCCTRGFAAQQKPERKGRTIRGGMLRAVSVERRETDRTSYTPVLITVAVDTRSASHSDTPLLLPLLFFPPSSLFDSDVYPPKAQLSTRLGWINCRAHLLPGSRQCLYAHVLSTGDSVSYSGLRRDSLLFDLSATCEK